MARDLLVPDVNDEISFTRSAYDTNNPAPTFISVNVTETQNDVGTGLNNNLGNPSWLTINTSTRSVSDGGDTLNFLDIEFVIDTAAVNNNHQYQFDYTIEDNGGVQRSYTFRYDNGYFDPTSPLNSDLIISRRYDPANDGDSISQIPNAGAIGGGFNVLRNGGGSENVVVRSNFAGGFGYYDFTGLPNRNEIYLESTFTDFLPTSSSPPDPFSVFFRAGGAEFEDSRPVVQQGGTNLISQSSNGGLQIPGGLDAGFRDPLNGSIYDFHLNYGGGVSSGDGVLFRNGVLENNYNNGGIQSFNSGTLTLFSSNDIRIDYLYEFYIYRSALTTDQIRKIRQGMANTLGTTVGNSAFPNDWNSAP